MQRIAAFNYTDPCSAGNRGVNDVKIGIENGACAANRAGGFKPSDLALISTLYEGRRVFHIATITSEDLGRTTIWSDRGGRDWSSCYRCTSHTPLFSTEDPAVIKVLKEEHNMSRRNISDMFSSHPCAGGRDKSTYRDVVMSLLSLPTNGSLF
jgi:hypothetical protein